MGCRGGGGGANAAHDVVAECEIWLGGGGQGNIRQISTVVFTMTKWGWVTCGASPA